MENDELVKMRSAIWQVFDNAKGIGREPLTLQACKALAFLDLVEVCKDLVAELREVREAILLGK